jgi:hypothetical protein
MSTALCKSLSNTAATVALMTKTKMKKMTHSNTARDVILATLIYE